MNNDSYSRLREIILEIINPKLGQAGIDPDNFDDHTDLLASAILDSFDYLDMISELEEKSGIPVDLAEIDDQDIAAIHGLINTILTGEK